jgi:hypothetical protein
MSALTYIELASASQCASLAAWQPWGRNFTPRRGVHYEENNGRNVLTQRREDAEQTTDLLAFSLAYAGLAGAADDTKH